MLTPVFRYDADHADLDQAPAHGDRLLLWLGRRQWRTIAGGILFGIPWMVAIAVQPAAIGRAVDEGIVAGDPAALWRWGLILLALGAAIGVFATLRHFFAVRNWLTASFRASLAADHGVRRAGPALTRDVPGGEVLTSFTTDFGRMGAAFDVTARFSGAIAAFVVVSVILLRSSVTIGLILLLGGPILMSSLALVVRVLTRRQETQRTQFGALAALGTDTVAGLRVLRGIGGEEEFLRRYAVQSARVRATGVHVAGVQALLQAAQVLLPGVFVVVVVAVGSQLALRGEITPGQLVAFFGYTAFLTTPLRTAVEFVESLTSSRVASRRIARLLAIAPDHPDPVGGEQTTPAVAGVCAADGGGPIPGPTAGAPGTSPEAGAGLGGDAAHELVDPVSGVVVAAGRLTALVSAQPDDAAAVLGRLGRTVPGRHGVRWGDVAVDDLPLATVRATALVSSAHPELFSGPVREEVGPGRSDADILAAVHAAAAEDVLEALPGGLDAILDERGRSLSGGQRQRLVLARALLAATPILLLVEPTSAVDTHTEARIVARLPRARAGQTTVVTSSSPLVLDAADDVILLEEGQAVARGPHRRLLATSPAYRELVTRGEQS